MVMLPGICDVGLLASHTGTRLPRHMLMPAAVASLCRRSPSKAAAKGARAAPPYTTSGVSVGLLQLSIADVSAEAEVVDCVVTSPVSVATTSPESSKVHRCLHTYAGMNSGARSRLDLAIGWVVQEDTGRAVG